MHTYVTVTRGAWLGRIGRGGGPYGSVFMLARAPFVGEGRVTGVCKWREHLIYIVERGDRMVSLG